METSQIQSTKSKISARFEGQKTVQLNLFSKSADVGEINRTPDGRLLLTLTPGLNVEEIVLPGSVPVLLEPTEGSLAVTCGNGLNERPSRLSIRSTNAPVKLDSMPLLSGTHSIIVIGKSADVTLSQVLGGVLDVETQSGNITIGIPAKTSASVEASVVSGKIQNLITPDQPQGDTLNFKMGDGKAKITMRATSGNVVIRQSD